jgi:hypothetical protein
MAAAVAWLEGMLTAIDRWALSVQQGDAVGLRQALEQARDRPVRDMAFGLFGPGQRPQLLSASRAVREAVDGVRPFLACLDAHLGVLTGAAVATA